MYKTIVKKLLYILICILLFNISPNFGNALTLTPANIWLKLDKNTYLDPDFLSLNIIGDSADLINLAEIKLKYNPENLSFASIDFSDGFCELFIYNNFDAIPGEINFACANTKSATSFDFAEIKFKKITAGWSNISLSGSKYFLHNGYGETVLPDIESNYFYIYK